jgi:hypothetical protein
MVRKRTRVSKSEIVKSYAEKLDRDYFDVLQNHIKKTLGGMGIYALYDKRGNLLYVGKASKLKQRLVKHKRTQTEWSNFSFYALKKKSQVDQLESFFLRIELPPWNQQRGKIGFEKSKNKTKSFKKEAKNEIKREKKANEADRQKIKTRKKRTRRIIQRLEKRTDKDKKRIKDRKIKTSKLKKIIK